MAKKKVKKAAKTPKEPITVKFKGSFADLLRVSAGKSKPKKA